MRTKRRQGHFRQRKSKRAKRQLTKMQDAQRGRYTWRVKKSAPYLKSKRRYPSEIAQT